MTVSASVVSADLGGEAVLLDLASGTYFGLDAVGARIWQLLGQEADEDELVECLLAKYAADADQLRRDVRSFLGELRSWGLARDAEV
jgi:PqqD family protein of HPr-rel-A system